MLVRSAPTYLPLRAGSCRRACRSAGRPDHPAPRRHDTLLSHTPGVDPPGKGVSMKRYMSCVGILLLAGVVVSCGGGGGGGGDSPAPATTTGSNPPSGGGNPPGGNPPGGNPPAASKPGRFEENNASVTLSPGHWSPTDAKFGWSGGNAVRSEVAGATVTFTFSGKWVDRKRTRLNSSHEWIS